MKPSDHLQRDENVAGFVMGETNEEGLYAISEDVRIDGNSTLYELERIAATVTLAGIDKEEELLPALRSSITAVGRFFVSEANSKSSNLATITPTGNNNRLREVIAWIGCIAASILTIYFWQSEGYRNGRQDVAAVTRESLIANSPDLFRVPWEKTTLMKDKPISGDVVWSGTSQRGFLRFVGMPVNDPSLYQYQLWIVDPSRDSEPIDGGVFDITSSEESIVEIQAKLKVNRPEAFAVTIEQPGGVVVSDLKLLSLMASFDSTD